MNESLESLALEAAGDIDDGRPVTGLSELLRALAGACRERDALRQKAVCIGTMQLIDDYANAVHDGADDRCAVLRRTIEAFAGLNAPTASANQPEQPRLVDPLP